MTADRAAESEIGALAGERDRLREEVERLRGGGGGGERVQEEEDAGSMYREMASARQLSEVESELGATTIANLTSQVKQLQVRVGHRYWGCC